MNNLNFSIAKLRHTADGDAADQAFKFWWNIWQQVERETNREFKWLTSDNFFYQDEAIVIRHYTEIVALFLLTHWNPALKFHFFHSYFQKFSSDIQEAIFNRAPKGLMSMSFLTVRDDWRRSSTHFSLSDVLVSLAVMRFQQSESEILFTYTRNDRKTHDLGYRHGGSPISTKYKYRDIDSHVLIFEKATSHISTDPVAAQVAKNLWNKTFHTQDVIKTFEEGNLITC